MATSLIFILVIFLPVIVLRRSKSNKLKAILNGIFEFLFGIGCLTFAWFLSDKNPVIDAPVANPDAMFARTFYDVAMYVFIVFGIVAFIFMLRSIRQYRGVNKNIDS
jgi:hypothetical protein